MTTSGPLPWAGAPIGRCERSAWPGIVARKPDLSARTLVSLVDPGSCFVGTLAELVLVLDRSFMLDGTDPTVRAPAAADAVY